MSIIAKHLTLPSPFPAEPAPLARKGNIGFAPDLNYGDVMVTDVENATKLGLFCCDQLVRFPSTVPGLRIVMCDQRTCVRR